MPLIRILIRVAYAPVFFVGFLWSAVILGDSGAPLWGLPILLGMALAVSFVVERVVPYERAWNRSHGDDGRDLLHAVVNETSIFLSVLAVPLVAGLIPDSGAWPDDWPLLWQLGAAILVADLGITLAHYASHRIAALWRLHAVHHAVKRMYGFNGLLKVTSISDCSPACGIICWAHSDPARTRPGPAKLACSVDRTIRRDISSSSWSRSGDVPDPTSLGANGWRGRAGRSTPRPWPCGRPGPRRSLPP